ncbi:CLUMA_CG005825, isoform A [Clunio marinus]|uniref:CLUMA_CG005825, isoform A n=1 Tax=Clunio marinus TaxID=568069 RepID=A0A1J1HW94_9DIPT|nr:CLUMA_CG005825, isoform A [Clunio marinus]
MGLLNCTFRTFHCLTTSFTNELNNEASEARTLISMTCPMLEDIKQSLYCLDFIQHYKVSNLFRNIVTLLSDSRKGLHSQKSLIGFLLDRSCLVEINS